MTSSTFNIPLISLFPTYFQLGILETVQTCPDQTHALSYIC